EEFFVAKAVIKSLSFVIPNSVVYLLRGKRMGLDLIRKEMEGFIDGIRSTKEITSETFKNNQEN
ncbi:MAG: hypothetical protein QXQ46_02040, partial [Thermoplasmatales archaeon]